MLVGAFHHGPLKHYRLTGALAYPHRLVVLHGLGHDVVRPAVRRTAAWTVGRVAQRVVEVVLRCPAGPRWCLLPDQHLVWWHRGELGGQVGGTAGLGVREHLVPEHPYVSRVVQGHPDRQGLPQ
ncbi:hypothetical protein GCM10029963_62220 [Micromonospora andamanensis]